MWRRPRTLVLAVVSSAALVPLFGDPRSTPVTHALWARLLLRSVATADVVRVSAQASEVFAALTSRDSQSLPASRYLRADRELLREGAGRSLLSDGTRPAEVVYTFPIVHAGDYQFRARITGPAGSPAAAEMVPLAGGPAAASFTFAADRALGWVFGGSAHLDPGAYAAQFILPPGFSLAQIELAPPCVHAIEPAGGWVVDAITTTEDLAVTAVQALEGEGELASASSPIELGGDDFQVETPAPMPRRAALEVTARVLRAGPKGLRAVVALSVPEAGLYVFSGLVGTGAGQRWRLDGCRKVVVCPGEGSRWQVILAQPLAAGRHTVELTLGDGASVERVRIEAKKSRPADYLLALRRLGFDPGTPGPVSRAIALDAAQFVRQRRALSSCGDRVLVEEAPLAVLAARVSEAPRGTSAAGTPAGGGGEPAQPPEPPIGPPILPPQPPATPTLPLGG